MSHIPLQRVGPLAFLPAVLRDLDVSLESAFAGSGITADALQPDARMAYSDLVTLLERSAVVARCPHLGLLVGARSDYRALGPVGEMMACAPTLGDAFRDYVSVQIGYSRAALVYLQRVGDDFLIGYGLYAAGGLGRQVHDLVAAMGVNLVRSLTGGQVQPLRVLISAATPARASDYRQVLRATALFDQEHTGLIIAGRDMELPLPGAQPARRQQLRASIRTMMSGDIDDVAAQVRHFLRPRLMIGEADREAIAREMGLGPRTLARRLARSGTSFEAIKDEVRFAIARELLALTRLPVGRIAEALSYSTNSAFDHAFKRWSDISPTEFRILTKLD